MPPKPNENSGTNRHPSSFSVPVFSTKDSATDNQIKSTADPPGRGVGKNRSMMPSFRRWVPPFALACIFLLVADNLRQHRTIGVTFDWALIEGQIQEPHKDLAMKFNDGPTKIETDERGVAAKTTTSFAAASRLQTTNETIPPIMGNSDRNMTDEFVRDMIVDYLNMDKLPFVLQRSLCEEESRLCHVSTTHSTDDMDDVEIQTWVDRLLFLLIHDHQHKHARAEAMSLEKTSSARFDFQCPGAKFLVISLQGYGLGAHARMVFVAALMAGILSDRVVLFMNNQKASKLTAKDWGWASCDRRDFQCVFLPPSPCLPTEYDLRHAAVVSSATVTFKNQRLAGMESHRVVFIDNHSSLFFYTPLHTWKSILSASVNNLVGRLEQSAGTGLPLIRRAARYLKTDDRFALPKHGAYSPLSFSETPLGQIMIIYSLRPNIEVQEYLRNRLFEIFPPSFSASRSFGLPIRGTDKCKIEAECFDFPMYMDLARQQWMKGIWRDSKAIGDDGVRDGNCVSIILTTEDVKIAKQRLPYESDSKFPFTFITDGATSAFGSGQAVARRSGGPTDSDIISALLAIKMQLRAKHIVGNCCSNFHNLFFDFVRRGCGLVLDATTECLLDNEDSRFHLCCKLPNGRCRVKGRPSISNPLTTSYKMGGNDGGCAATVVVADPRIPYFPANDTMFTKTLESFAEYMPNNACLVLQTSSCKLQQECVERDASPNTVLYIGDETSSDRGHYTSMNSSCHGGERMKATKGAYELLSEVEEFVHARAGPHLKAWMKRGRVRVSILDHSKYGLKACDNFFSPNFFFLSAQYWREEFVSDDSDTVVVAQRDVFLCKPLDLSVWGGFDYVGSPWHKGWPWMQNLYKSNTLRIDPQRKVGIHPNVEAWQEYWKQHDADDIGDLSHLADLGPNLTFPQNLDWRGSSPWVGNGGFSLRSRKWMIRMIRLCPHQQHSGVTPTKLTSAFCSIAKGIQEDMFFSLMLSLTGANLPSPELASFFGMDQDFGWPNDFLHVDNAKASDWIKQMIGANASTDFNQEMREIGHALPVGQHKCFKSFKKGGYGCAEKQWCKYSFNEAASNAVNIQSDAVAVQSASSHQVLPMNNHRKLLFVHIPKTGGTAIESAAARANISWSVCHFVGSKTSVRISHNLTVCPDTATTKLAKPMPLFGVPHWHLPPNYFLYEERYASWNNTYANATLFAVVRNPFDRFISQYFYHMDEMSRRPDDYLSDPKNLNDWVHERLTKLDVIPNNLREPIHAGTNTTLLGKLNYFLGLGHFIPQYDFIFDKDGRRVIEHVLRFENLTTEFAALMDSYGLGDVVQLPRKAEGKGRQSHHRGLGVANLTSVNIRLIESYYLRDFQAFGYPTVNDVPV